VSERVQKSERERRAFCEYASFQGKMNAYARVSTVKRKALDNPQPAMLAEDTQVSQALARAPSSTQLHSTRAKTGRQTDLPGLPDLKGLFLPWCGWASLLALAVASRASNRQKAFMVGGQLDLCDLCASNPTVSSRIFLEYPNQKDRGGV
jgi:hypothetical protein